MAAFRRLISTSTNFSSTSGRFVFWKQTPKRTKTFKHIATGVCIATGAGFASYYNVQKKLSNQIDNGLLLALPAVSATDKVLYSLLVMAWGISVYIYSMYNKYHIYMSM